MTASHAEAPLLEVRGLVKDYEIGGGLFAKKEFVRAVRGVDLDVRSGETLGVVGESGCGKSTLGRSILRLIEPTSGTVRFRGVDLGTLSGADLRRKRRSMQIIFQDPYSSLNPRMTVNQIIEEPLKLHTKLSTRERRERVLWLLSKVGLTAEQSNRYPHEFSGGQRQRIGIARALATRPRIIIADEPVSALDVSIQAQVINLMEDLQDEFKLSYIFIAHDLSVVRHISDRIAVMYLGHIVEIGPSDMVYRTPTHPYSRALLSAVPRPDPDVAHDRIRLTGDVPNPIRKPSGCAFRTRCPIARPSCADAVPPLEIREGRLVACPWV
jgi:oligopeptide transport system ATP-binding protein